MLVMPRRVHMPLLRCESYVRIDWGSLASSESTRALTRDSLAHPSLPPPLSGLCAAVHLTSLPQPTPPNVQRVAYSCCDPCACVQHGAPTPNPRPAPQPQQGQVDRGGVRQSRRGPRVGPRGRQTEKEAWAASETQSAPAAPAHAPCSTRHAPRATCAMPTVCFLPTCAALALGCARETARCGTACGATYRARLPDLKRNVRRSHHSTAVGWSVGRGLLPLPHRHGLAAMLRPPSGGGAAWYIPRKSDVQPSARPTTHRSVILHRNPSLRDWSLGGLGERR